MVWRDFRALLAAPVCLGLIVVTSLSAAADPAPAAVTTIAVFGDSQGEGLAVGLRQVLQGNKAYHLLNRTKAGTAISQPLDYPWPDRIDDFTHQEKADVAVMFFGGNDRLPMRVAEGKPIPFRSPQWEAIYKQRVARMVASLTKAGIKVIWCGEPIAREPTYTSDMAYVNTLFQAVVPAGGAVFLPLWTVISDGNNGYAAYGKSDDGTTARLRGVDGIHFTEAGYRVLARHVLDAVNAAINAGPGKKA
jgi:hypothetical protein